MGRTAVVAGGASGVGRVIAERFADAGSVCCPLNTLSPCVSVYILVHVRLLTLSVPATAIGLNRATRDEDVAMAQGIRGSWPWQDRP